MRSLKTLSCLVFLSAAPASAFTSSAEDQLRFFASCAGRLSAMMEHQWTYDTGAVDETTQRRQDMMTLVSAVMPQDAGRDVLLLRVQAKHAQARLLQRAVVNRDPNDAQWAEARAEALLSECTSILIR